MRYYLISGEASGDLHGANLMRGLREAGPRAEFRFWGGDRMAEVGGAENLVTHYRDTSFFGLVNVVLHARTIFHQISRCKRDIEAWQPDVVILIDYPGFNFRIAKWAHGQGRRVFYYIAPKVWAWKEGRVKRLRKYVERLFVIFPFEVEYFRRHGIEAIYEGNPLMDAISARRAVMPSREEFLLHNNLQDKPIIAVLAGSRASEVKHNLAAMLAVAPQFEEYQFVVAGVSWLDKSLYQWSMVNGQWSIIFDKTYELLNFAQAAVVVSGTATLETALMGTPQVVVYKTDPLTAFVALRIFHIGDISLVNINMGRQVVAELKQGQVEQHLTEELRAVLAGGTRRAGMLADYGELQRLIGSAGSSERAARRMTEILTQIKK